MKALSRFSFFLVPSLLQGAMSVLMLPVATRILGPQDYGVFALACAYTGLGSALASLGAGYVIANRFHADGRGQAEHVVSTISILGLCAVSAYAVVLYGLWPLLPGVEHVPASCFWLALAAMICGYPWSIAMDILVIRGDARQFAAISIAQTLISAAALAAGLFLFGLGTSALFVAQLSGALVGLVGAVVALRGYLRPRVDLDVVRELCSVGLVSGLGNLIEALQVALERGVLSIAVGLFQLGIYTHSHQYRTIAAMPAKAIARSFWPLTLSEARDRSSDFSGTRMAWNIAYIALTLCGVVFATVGDRVIDLLTNGKFTDAHILATCWMMYLLLVNSGKPQTGVLYALGGGRTYARLVVASGIAAAGALVVLIPLFGVWGAVAAAVLQQVCLRAGIQSAARAIRRVPFQDRWACFGIAYIASTLLMRLYFGGSLGEDLVILTASSGLLLVITYRTLLTALHRVGPGRSAQVVR